MKKRKFIGFMTILSGLPGIGGFLLFKNGVGELSSIAVMAFLAIVCRGIFGVVGGVLLWRGERLGYQLSSIMWTYMVVVGLISFYQLFTGPYPASFELTPESRLFWSILGRTLGKLIWGIPFLYILLKALKEGGKDSDENVGLPQQS